MSSIFENKNLLDELIKCGLEDERKFSKKGQEAPGPTDYAAVQRMITSLQHRIRPPQNAEETPGTPAASQQGATEQAKVNPATLEELISLQPFNSQYIDTQAILTFAQKFASLANTANISIIAQELESDIRNADGLTARPGLPIQMENLTASQFKNSTGSPQPQQLARILYTIISTAGRMYQLFYAQYREKMGNAARAVEQQIASGGPQQTNLADLLELIQALDREWQQGFNNAPTFRDRGRI